METVEKVTKFAKLVIAQLTGDDNKVIAFKNERLATQAIKGQLSALEMKLVNDEIAKEQAEENLANIIAPKDLIVNAEGYAKRIIGAKNELDEKIDALEQTKKTIEYFKTIQKEYFN